MLILRDRQPPKAMTRTYPNATFASSGDGGSPRRKHIIWCWLHGLWGTKAAVGRTPACRSWHHAGQGSEWLWGLCCLSILLFKVVLLGPHPRFFTAFLVEWSSGSFLQECSPHSQLAVVAADLSGRHQARAWVAGLPSLFLQRALLLLEQDQNLKPWNSWEAAINDDGLICLAVSIFRVRGLVLAGVLWFY